MAYFFTYMPLSPLFSEERQLWRDFSIQLDSIYNLQPLVYITLNAEKIIEDSDDIKKLGFKNCEYLSLWSRGLTLLFRPLLYVCYIFIGTSTYVVKEMFFVCPKTERN